jgi:aryl sulfotransferase
MAGIVWLASYPKSGNTWARVFVQNYLDPLAPADINQLTIRHAAQHALFDQFGAVEISDLTDDEVQSLRPALYRTMAAAAADPLFLKVHDAFGPTADGAALIPHDVTRAAIYIVRHPGDVAVSLAHHSRLSPADAVGMLCREESILRDRAGQCRQHLRSWSGHVRSWVDEPRVRVCVIRYEDLLADPPREFSRMLAASGLAIDQPRLVQAIEQSRFERLQAQERAAGFTERPAIATAAFFRDGRSGSWRDHLTADQVRRLVDVHGPVMQRFGYLTPGGDPPGLPNGENR